MRRTKIRIRHYFSQIQSDCEEQKQKGLHSIFCPKLGKKRKKRSSLKFSPIFGPKLTAGQKQSLRLPFVCSKLLPNLQRGAMPRFCILFYANHTILANQRGGHGQMASTLVQNTVSKCNGTTQVLVVLLSSMSLYFVAKYKKPTC